MTVCVAPWNVLEVESDNGPLVRLGSLTCLVQNALYGIVPIEIGVTVALVLVIIGASFGYISPPILALNTT